MIIQEVYSFLFENYRQLDEVFYQAISLAGDSYEHQSALELARELSIIRRGGTLVDVYETLVKKNLLFAAKTQKDKDASYWTGYFSQMLRTRNEVATTFAIQEFSQLVFDSLTELKNRKEEKEGKEKYKVIHKASNWVLFKVEHKMAACRLGSGTKWCISARGDRNYFDNYKHDNDVFMLHTRNEKFAILVNKSTKKVFEVQYSENDYESPSPSVMQDFMKRIKEEGVDINKLQILTGAKDLIDLVVTIDDIEVKEYGDEKVFSGHKFKTYRVYYKMSDNTGRRWEKLLLDGLFGSVESPNGGTAYSWVQPDTGTGRKVWERIIYNDELTIPVDSEKLNRLIIKAKSAMRDIDVDPEALTLSSQMFMKIFTDAKSGTL